MRIKSRYKADADLYEYTGNNMLYDLLKLPTLKMGFAL